MTNDERFDNEKFQEFIDYLQFRHQFVGTSIKSLQEDLLELAPPNGINWAEFRRRVYQPIMPNNWLKRNKIPMRRGKRKNDK